MAGLYTHYAAVAGYTSACVSLTLFSDSEWLSLTLFHWVAGLNDDFAAVTGQTLACVSFEPYLTLL